MGIPTLKSDPEDFISSAIIGFGAIGQALARAFARKDLQQPDDHLRLSQRKRRLSGRR
jgi:hypothetical protein